MAIIHKKTFCRVCEPGCPLDAQVEQSATGERLLGLSPQRDHPLSGGFACHKGVNFTQIHLDRDRLDHPQRRDGKQWANLSWPQALQEIADKTRAIRERHGNDVIAGYIGNPTAFNALGGEAIVHFFRQLGTRHVFNSGTQDCANKFAGAEAVYGTSTLHPIPDIGRSSFCLIFGENPKVSHMSFLSIFDPMAALRAVVSRGGRVVYVNPRRIESASPRTGEVLQIKPDTDLYLMAALLHEMQRAGLWREDILAAHGERVDALRDFIAPYSAERVAPVVGLDAGDIRTLAHDFGTAPSACVHMSTGVNMGRQGTLCYWLLQMLSLVSGNLDRRGGNLYSLGFYPAARAGRVSVDHSPFFDSSYGELRHIRGALPANLMADFIGQPDKPVKALFVIAGNPLLSIGGEAALRHAFTELELLVVIDIFRNVTGELAHYTLPATDMLERADLNLCGLGMQSVPHVQYTDAVVPPSAERREEWWILGKLAQAMGLPSPFDADEAPDPFARLNSMLRHAGLDIAQLKTAPGQCALLPDHQTGRFFSDWLQRDSQRVDCCPPLFDAAISQSSRIFNELATEPADTLKLITLRTNHMLNSWFHNAPYLKRSGFLDNPLHINAEDAARLALAEGDEVTVQSAWGHLQARVHIDDSLRPGVVAMTHGWGHRSANSLGVASRHPGANVNRLLPRGPGSYERLSNQAHMTGIRVSLARPGAI
ncbi:molybdopterin-containing oxidoreductase family protein [Parahaliea mediterranea]|uniref:molybdopterin-containing oxidoreductase family protein n=1 Tax=Parahaliea mediterranea TaxID=651086 RepID=UPI000E2FCE5B|nr:molybdopterin-dependent oxidoreductase [Parahaliea mediterranea]